MTELGVRVVRNGVFVPAGTVSKFDLIYDENLNLVDESGLRRHENREDISRGPAKLDESLVRSSGIIDEKAVFLGWYDVTHYGHWLTEGLSRFWYLQSSGLGDYKIPIAWNMRRILKRIRDLGFQRKKVHWPSAFQAFGISSPRLLRMSGPSRIKEIHVPECSMINGCLVHQEHLDVTRKIAQYVVDIDSLVRDERPVYLSRTKLKGGVHGYRGEQPIEDYCRKSGYRIVYPEELSLKEQIEMFNRHDTFVGLIGSAFHSIMFRLPGRAAKCVYLGNDTPNTNYANIDKLMGNEALYVDCCDYEDREARIFRCDEQLAISLLKGI